MARAGEGRLLAGGRVGRIPVQRDRAAGVGADLRVGEDPVRGPVAPGRRQVDELGGQPDHEQPGPEGSGPLPTLALGQCRVERADLDLIGQVGPALVVDQAHAACPRGLMKRAQRRAERGQRRRRGGQKRGARDSAGADQQHAPGDPISPDLDQLDDLLGLLSLEQRTTLLDGGLLRDDELAGDDARGGEQQQRPAHGDPEQLRVPGQDDVEHREGEAEHRREQQEQRDDPFGAPVRRHHALARIDIRPGLDRRRRPTARRRAERRARRHEKAEELREPAHAGSSIRSPISRATITSAARPMNHATIPSGIGPML